MDIMSMLMNARIIDEDGDEVGEVVGVTINGGKMILATDIIGDLDIEFTEDDPDGGEEIDEEDDTEDDEEKKTPTLVKLVAGGAHG